MSNIQRVSLCFRLFFQLCLILMPVLLIVSWVYAPENLVLLSGFIQLKPIPAAYQGMHAYTMQGLPKAAIFHALSMGEKIIGGAISAIPLLIQMSIVFWLIKLFRLYEKGSIFSLTHVKYIRNIGYALILSQVIEPIYQFVMGIVLTWHNPPHHHYAAITLDQTNVGVLLTAFLIILISWIMAQGYQLKEEQQLTI